MPAELRPTAEAAVRSTTAQLAAREPASGVDLSLCHGLAGQVDLLLEAASVLGSRASLDLASRVWAGQAESHALSHAWTTGVPGGGANPSLMVGTAGIGYALLRLHDPGAGADGAAMPCSDEGRRALPGGGWADGQRGAGSPVRLAGWRVRLPGRRPRGARGDA